MTCKGFLRLCESVSHFSNDEFEVWVRGEGIGDARPIVSLDDTQMQVLLTCAGTSDGSEGVVCHVKDLVGLLREKVASFDAEREKETRCFVCCQDVAGETHYFDLADERPVSLIDDDTVIFKVQEEDFFGVPDNDGNDKHGNKQRKESDYVL